ncbi:1-acyl-sn-glycerol-3-phosphate acyltransferase [Desulfomarina profundi]|uniref:1-acyl-sn-glycerol-3-phosphate acyltransferase n=1 Tax=Desulfomarina profundi TaxID=2772557 RepID=A0A8D5JI53_9BACT|nr:lysophospholipid acyltransferase family protein [Desulfomarina profundi]BCL62299.1 1-acyl-sn-glycerol-3-phosphate acyltransferase [Desulfomarina profundi]
MRGIQYQNGIYRTPAKQLSFFGKMLPSLSFYSRFLLIVASAGWKAKQGKYDSGSWIDSSLDVLLRLENAGIRVEISGIENLLELNEPVVIIGNHMSMMETLLLPGIIQPLMEVTFVVKQSLLDYPVFKYVMRSRNPIAVSRTNPRSDLKVVMTDGVERLKNGISVIVFPQTTRSQDFDAKQMSSIGVKLAKKACVNVVPLALKTDAWQNGRMVKDFGRLDVKKTAYFSFGKSLRVEGKGNEEQAAINNFIAEKLRGWQK